MYYTEYCQYVTVVNPEVDIRSSGRVHKMAFMPIMLYQDTRKHTKNNDNSVCPVK